MLKGFKDRHYRATARLRASPEFQIFLEGLQLVRQTHVNNLVASDEDAVIKRTQGRIRELDSLIEIYNKAPEIVDKLSK